MPGFKSSQSKLNKYIIIEKNGKKIKYARCQARLKNGGQCNMMATRVNNKEYNYCKKHISTHTKEAKEYIIGIIANSDIQNKSIFIKQISKKLGMPDKLLQDNQETIFDINDIINLTQNAIITSYDQAERPTKAVIDLTSAYSRLIEAKERIRSNDINCVPLIDVQRLLREILKVISDCFGLDSDNPVINEYLKICNLKYIDKMKQIMIALNFSRGVNKEDARKLSLSINN